MNQLIYIEKNGKNKKYIIIVLNFLNSVFHVV